jgi:glycosyltransferase involved in cell wall biosynthesis
MKILIISPTQSGIGGVAKQIQGLLKFLLINNIEVDVVSSENTFIVPIRGFKNLSFMFSSFIKTKFMTKQYDVVHANNPVSAIAMKNVNGKKILTLWGSYTEQIKLLHGNIAGKLSEKLEDESLKTAHIITTSSSMIVKYCSKLGYNAHFIPDAIDFDELPKNVDRKYEKQIIYVGRLSKEKGILQLLEVCKKLPLDMHLLILGTGPEEKKIIQLSNTSKNIHYLGYQPKEKTIPLIRGSDILIQPSLMEGGINTTALEAMACNTSILATSLEDQKDVLRHMDTAFCVNPKSTSELLKGIFELMNDSILRSNLSKNAYLEVQKYSWNVIGKQYLEIYRNS